MFCTVARPRACFSPLVLAGLMLVRLRVDRCSYVHSGFSPTGKVKPVSCCVGTSGTEHRGFTANLGFLSLALGIHFASSALRLAYGFGQFALSAQPNSPYLLVLKSATVT